MGKGRGRRRMVWVLCSIALLITAVIIFFRIPYSMTKAGYQDDIQVYKNKFKLESDVFLEQDIKELPEPVQTYLKVSGYMGKTKMTSMKAYISSAPLKDTEDKPPMIVDYTLCSFAEEPVRLAYISTSLYGIPFEAYDSTQNGIGFMKGVLGKVFTLFNQKGHEMDKGQLLTYLSECFFIPSSVFSDYITWESIDSKHAKAVITYNQISGSGIFTFDDHGFVTSFQTDERAKVSMDGSIAFPKWSLVYERFEEKDGLFYPAHVKTIWHERDGDFVYFDADNIKFTFDE